MDPTSFDRLGCHGCADEPASRPRSAYRRCLLGSLTGGTVTRAAQAVICTYEFVTMVRLGPSAGQLLTPDAVTPGEVRGQLSFGLDTTGALVDAMLSLTNDTVLLVTEQATGASLNLRIEGCLPATLTRGQASLDRFANQITLKIVESTEDVAVQLTARCSGVDLLG